MPGAGPIVQHGLTVGQEQLLKRHERGLLRLAVELAARNGLEATEVMFVLADRKGRLGRALSTALATASIGPVVLPGRAFEREAWVAGLALHGPVWDLTDGTTGTPVVVVDEHDAMAVIHLVERSS